MMWALSFTVLNDCGREINVFCSTGLVWVVKKFLGLVGFESVCVLGLLLFLYGVLGSVWFWFGALSMLPKVTFDVVKSDVLC